MAPTAMTHISHGVHRGIYTTKLQNAGETKNKLSTAEVIQLEHKYGAHNYHPLPVVFDSAKGAKVWDPEGNTYIDMLSAYSAVNQGHCHPLIIQTLIEQSQKLTLSSRAFYNKAVETGVKLARKWAYEKKGVPEGQAVVFSAQGNFHGRTLAVISMSTDPESRGGFDDGETKVIRYGVIEDVERALELYGDKVAAFLVEPIQGEAGIVVPPEGYLAKVAALCKKYNVLLICDEIQTGLCRTGKMLACEYDGIRPDIVLLGKALSGGVYPVSAVLADSDIMLCIRPGEHVATTALRVLVDEKLADRAMRLGDYFRNAVREIGSPLVKEIRGRGLLNAVVIDEEKSARGRTAWQFCLLLKSRGVLAKPTHINIIRFAPPLVIEEEDLKKAVNVIKECLEDLDKLDYIPGEVESEIGHKETLTL
ncbi:pyridoxal phosphate-dependent transferase [Cyathus striatus]|nr:pyridoxal phosphate-dependent transferase [Cyathus striatus]